MSLAISATDERLRFARGDGGDARLASRCAAPGGHSGFKGQNHFEMQNAFAGDRFPGFLVARTVAMDLALNSLPALGDSATQLVAQVESAAMTQGAGARELKHRFGRLKICPVAETMSKGDDFMIEVQEIHGESF